MTDDTGRLPLPTHTGQPSASDERRFGFFMIHNSVVDNFGLTPYEGWLYVIIARHVNQKTGVAFPSLTTLSNEGRMSRMQVTRCLKSLQEKGLLEVTPQPITGKRFSTLCGPMGSGTVRVAVRRLCPRFFQYPLRAYGQWNTGALDAAYKVKVFQYPLRAYGQWNFGSDLAAVSCARTFSTLCGPMGSGTA